MWIEESPVLAALRTVFFTFALFLIQLITCACDSYILTGGGYVALAKCCQTIVLP